MLADIVVIAIVAIFIIVGAKVGLIRSLLGMGNYILSVIISVTLYPMVSEFLMGTPLFDFIAENINESVAAELIQNTGSGINGLLALMNSDAESITANMSAGIATLLINVISFILVLVLSRVVLGIVIKAVDLVTKLPVIKQFNRLGGAVFGGIKGILVLYIVFALAVLFEPFDDNSEVIRNIEESTFAKGMYEDNVLFNLIGKENVQIDE